MLLNDFIKKKKKIVSTQAQPELINMLTCQSKHISKDKISITILEVNGLIPQPFQ